MLLGGDLCSTKGAVWGGKVWVWGADIQTATNYEDIQIGCWLFGNTKTAIYFFLIWCGQRGCHATTSQSPGHSEQDKCSHQNRHLQILTLSILTATKIRMDLTCFLCSLVILQTIF